MRSDMDRMRPEDQMRDHGNSGMNDERKDRERSGGENGYQHTNYEQQKGSHGHAKPPPVTSHNSQRSEPATSLDDEQNNGPGD